MTETDKMLTIQEVMKILGISRVTLYTIIKEGKIPAYKIGHNYRILESELEKYINQNRIGGEQLLS